MRQAVHEVLDFWLDMGVDGLRLDAVPYLYEREGTMCENLPETHEELKALRRHVDERYQDRMLLAEANQWPEDAIAYFGDGDECHMAFHFPLMPRLFMAIRQENRFPIIDILEQTPPIPDGCQWALFLRNHDELTLEMVTDEERDYMYRTYAQDRQARLNLGIRRRLAPLLGNSRRQIELMNALLLSLPGTPIVYYGDEIGMGDNIYLGDRNGVRTPMQWSSDRNAGFSEANPQQLYLPTIVDPEYHFETVNVDAQHRNPNSLLWWMRRILALRKQHRVFGWGEIQFLHPDNPRVLAFLRRFESEAVLVVANLSRYNQFVELDLSAFAEAQPVDLFGRTPFPVIGELPYFLTLAPHAFFWFELSPPAEHLASPATQIPDTAITLLGGAESLFHDPTLGDLERIVGNYIGGQVWYQGRRKKMSQVEIVDWVPLSPTDFLAIVTVGFLDGEPETYLVPIGIVEGEDALQTVEGWGGSVLCHALVDGRPAVLADVTRTPHFVRGMLAALEEGAGLTGNRGRIAVSTTEEFDAIDFEELRAIDDIEGHTSILVDDRMVLKLFRRIDDGPNPDLELRRFLTERTGFTNFAPVQGWFEYQGGERAVLAILQDFVAHEREARESFLSSLDNLFDHALSTDQAAPVPEAPPLRLVESAPPDEVADLLATDLQGASRLGELTARLHLALASDREDPELRPVRFSSLYQRSLYQSLRTTIRQVLLGARRTADYLPEPLAGPVRSAADLEARLLERLSWLLRTRVDAGLIRIHGDLRLDEVLDTGRDYVFHDFAGDTTRPLSERRLKRSPLRDIADLVRSLHYVAQASLRRQVDRGAVTSERLPSLEPWAQAWYRWVTSALLRSYFEVMGESRLLPADREIARSLLEVYVIERAARELDWELHNRPEWVTIPIAGLQEALEPGLI